MKPNRPRLWTMSGLAWALMVASSAYGQGPQAGPPDLTQIQRQLEEQRQKLTAQQRALEEEERQLEAQRRALQETRRQLEALEAQVGAKPKPAPQPGAQAQPAPPTVGRAPEKPGDARPPEVPQLFDQPGVLTPRRQLVLEPSLQYSYSSTNRVALVGYTVIPALVIGAIDVRGVNRNTWIAAVTARYGITNRLEVETKVPYVYRNDDSVTRPLAGGANQDSVFNASGKDIGDVELAMRYQLNRPAPDAPYYVAGLRLKTRTGKDPFEVRYASGSSQVNTLQEELPTGSGFYGVQPSLSVIYPSDPAVFFGGVNYLWNIERDVNTTLEGIGTPVGTVDPGDAFGFNFGMGLAINERAAFSLGYEHTWIGKTKIDGEAPSGATSTQLSSLLLGYSYRLNRRTSFNFSIGAGLTQDTPDVQLTLRVPVVF